MFHWTCTSSFHYMRPLTLFQLLAYAAVEVFPTFPFILVPIYRTNLASDMCLDGRSLMNISTHDLIRDLQSGSESTHAGIIIVPLTTEA